MIGKFKVLSSFRQSLQALKAKIEVKFIIYLTIPLNIAI